MRWRNYPLDVKEEVYAAMEIEARVRKV